MKLLLATLFVPSLILSAAPAPTLTRPTTPEVDVKAPETVPTQLEELSKEQLIAVIHLQEQEIARLTKKIQELEKSKEFYKQTSRHIKMRAAGASHATAATASASSPAYQAATQASAAALSSLLKTQQK